MNYHHCCVHFAFNMCPVFDNIHRYTSLIWDSEKKTLFGKNGVSWLSIFLGTLVVILGIGVFMQCIRDVKKSRQESDAQLRKMLLEKRQLSAAPVDTSVARNANSCSGAASTNTVNIPVVNEPLKKPLYLGIPEEFENYEYLKENGLLVRKKKCSSLPNVDEVQFGGYKGIQKSKSLTFVVASEGNKNKDLEKLFKEIFVTEEKESIDNTTRSWNALFRTIAEPTTEVTKINSVGRHIPALPPSAKEEMIDNSVGEQLNVLPRPIPESTTELKSIKLVKRNTQTSPQVLVELATAQKIVAEEEEPIDKTTGEQLDAVLISFAESIGELPKTSKRNIQIPETSSEKPAEKLVTEKEEPMNESTGEQGNNPLRPIAKSTTEATRTSLNKKDTLQTPLLFLEKLFISKQIATEKEEPIDKITGEELNVLRGTTYLVKTNTQPPLPYLEKLDTEKKIIIRKEEPNDKSSGDQFNFLPKLIAQTTTDVTKTGLFKSHSQTPPSFFEKLATARLERLKRDKPIFDHLEEVFGSNGKKMEEASITTERAAKTTFFVENKKRHLFRKLTDVKLNVLKLPTLSFFPKIAAANNLQKEASASDTSSSFKQLSNKQDLEEGTSEAEYSGKSKINKITKFIGKISSATRSPFSYYPLSNPTDRNVGKQKQKLKKYNSKSTFVFGNEEKIGEISKGQHNVSQQEIRSISVSVDELPADTKMKENSLNKVNEYVMNTNNSSDILVRHRRI